MTQPDAYACHGFHPELPKGRATGQLQLQASGIDFTVGGRRGHLPWSGLQLERGGAGDRLVFLKHPAAPEWSLYTSDRRILKHRLLSERPELLHQVRSVRKRRTLQGGLIAAVLGLFVILPVLALTQWDWLTRQAARQVPQQWEQQLGEAAFNQYVAEHQLMASERAQALLQPLVEPLLAAIENPRHDYAFYIAKDPSLNAFALPDGTIVIHSGLINQAERAEELLGVLGHEITHVTEQHGVRNIIGSAGLYLTISLFFGDASGLLGGAASAAPFLMSQSYSRAYEREADRLGVALLQRARIDPSGLVHFFEKLLTREQAMLAKMDNERARELIKDTLTLLSTHPASDERIAYLRSLHTDRDKVYLDLTNEFESLKLAVGEFAAPDADDSQEGPRS